MSAAETAQLEQLRIDVAERSALVPATRYGFIDLLRGFALVVMVETHVVNAYLPPSARENLFFFGLTFINGLVAPSFLFAAGFSVRLQAERLWDEWLHFGPALWRQARRLGFITIIAYYTHLRGFKFSKYVEGEAGIWRETLQVDILQCIVASLLLIHVLILVLRTPRRVFWGAAGIACAVALATPAVWAHDFTGRTPLGLALFLAPHGVSYFPVFPWVVFVLAGCAGAHLFLEAVRRGDEVRRVRIAVLGAAWGTALALAARHLPFTLPGRESFFTTSPLYVVVRLACVIAIAAGLFGLERFRCFGPRPILVAGQESLLVYGVHLRVIFAVLRGKHLGPILGLQGGWLVCLATSAAVVAAMLWLARHWHRLKRAHPAWTRRGQAAAVVIMAVIFLLR